MTLRTIGLYRGWIADAQGPENQVEIMASHVAERTVPKIPPVMPIVRMVEGMKILHRGRADPKIPIETGRNRCRLGRKIHLMFETTKTAWTPKPDMHFVDGTNGSRLDQFHAASVICASVNLRSHLCHHFLLPRDPHQRSNFVNRMSQWLFAIAVLAPIHRFRRDNGVSVVGCRDDNRINLLVHLVQHHTIIGEAPRPGKLRGELVRLRHIYIAQRNDILARDQVQISFPLIAQADTGDVEFLVRRRTLRLSQDAGPNTRPGKSGVANHGAAVYGRHE